MSKETTSEPIESRIEKIEVTGESERLKKIEKKIMDETEEKAKLILKDAEKTRRDTAEEKRKEGEREAEKITRAGTEEADSLKMQRVAEARLKAKQMIIASREELINETLEKTKEKLLNLTASKDYDKILRKMVEEGGIGLGGGELEIILPGKGARAALDLNSIAKQVEKTTGKPTTIRIVQEKSKSIGGAIIRKADGSIIIDNSFEARIDRAMRDIRIQVAKLLFE